MPWKVHWRTRRHVSKWRLYVPLSGPVSGELRGRLVRTPTRTATFLVAATERPTAGETQVQAEAAEVLFRKIELRPLK